MRLRCDNQIAHVLTWSGASVVEHFFIDSIHSCWNGVGESTTSHDGIKILKGDAFFLQGLHDFYFVAAEVGQN